MKDANEGGDFLMETAYHSGAQKAGISQTLDRPNVGKHGLFRSNTNSKQVQIEDYLTDKPAMTTTNMEEKLGPSS